MKKLLIYTLLVLNIPATHTMFLKKSNQTPKKQSLYQNKKLQRKLHVTKSTYSEKKFALKKDIISLKSNIERKSHEITFCETSAILCAIIGMEINTTFNISKYIFLFGCGVSFAAQKSLTNEINKNVLTLEKKQIELEELEFLKTKF